MKEFIFGIEEENSDYAEVFYGWIRNNSPELIRCKDCKHWSEPDHVDDEYVESYCRELGIFDTSPTSYCSYAKRKEE